MKKKLTFHKIQKLFKIEWHKVIKNLKEQIFSKHII